LSENQAHIEEQLRAFKIKFVKKRLLEGVLVFLFSALLLYLTVSGIEAIGRFNSWIRAILFMFFLTVSSFVLFIRIVRPLLQLLRADIALADDEAAQKIGKYFPTINDKLLNYIQLNAQIYKDNQLAVASLDQRANEMRNYDFDEAIDYKSEKERLIKYILPVVFVSILLIVIFPKVFIGSTERIIYFSESFVPEAPFKLNITNDLIGFRNEDFTLRVNTSGDAIPEEVFFVADNKTTRMVNAGLGSFELLFSNITTSKSFTIEAAGFNFGPYNLNVVDRPSLSQFSVSLDYPGYLKMPSESFQNIGSFQVPEGTKAIWQIKSKYANDVTVVFGQDSSKAEQVDSEMYSFNRQILTNESYSISLKNEFGSQNGTISYDVTVIKDEAPTIEVKVLPDTVLYKYIVFAGNISDDHGIRRLALRYTKNTDAEKTIPLEVDRSAPSQSLFHQWLLDSVKIKQGDKLSFYLEVSDNDAINGSKKTRSQIFYLNIPNAEEASQVLEESKAETKEQIKDTAEEAKELKENIDKLVEDLKGKKELSWQEEQMLQNLIEQKEALEKEIEKLKQENRMLNEQQKQFNEPSSETLQKQEQLQELLEDLMDEKTREMYEELQKMLESYESTEAVQDMLEKIQNKELNLEQELERALEYFKQIQYEQKLDEATEELDSLIEKQEELLEKTENEEISSDSLAEEQGKLNEDFQDFQEKMRDAKELNQELKRPNAMEDTSGEEKEVNDAQKDAKENLENNDRNKSKTSQENAKKKMEQISKKLEAMQSSMQMEQMQEDLGDLQAILSNLIDLSYSQENLMGEFKAINQSDPEFIKLSQEQLNLKEESKIINDSLLALSSRVMAIASFVTRELNEMNRHMDASITSIRERKKSEAGVSQQLTMTSANNLALMLDNVMQQMQENMSNAMGKGDQQGDQQMPGLSEMQEKLNEQIRELSQSGKSGRELSEELAKLAAEQERIRKALEEAEEKYGNGQGENESLKQQMERTEMDLVNKNLNRQTLQRQQQILTRMLEAEQSLRERELDTKREAKTATQYEKMLPKAFEEYIKQREKEIELLKTVPPKLVPFFKLEVSDYFDRIKQQNVDVNN
jgi:hypothetical protein